MSSPIVPFIKRFRVQDGKRMPAACSLETSRVRRDGQSHRFCQCISRKEAVTAACLLYPCHPCIAYLPLFTYIWLIFMVNVGKCTIHGCNELCFSFKSHSHRKVSDTFPWERVQGRISPKKKSIKILLNKREGISTRS